MNGTATAIQHMLYELAKLESLVGEEVDLSLRPDGSWMLTCPDIRQDGDFVLLMGDDFEAEFFNRISEIQDKIRAENETEMAQQLIRSEAFLNELLLMTEDDND